MNNLKNFLDVLLLGLWSAKFWLLAAVTIIFVPLAFLVISATSGKTVSLELKRLPTTWNLEFARLNSHTAMLSKKLGYVTDPELKKLMLSDQFRAAVQLNSRIRKGVSTLEDEVFDQEFFRINTKRLLTAFIDVLEQPDAFGSTPSSVAIPQSGGSVDVGDLTKKQNIASARPYRLLRPSGNGRKDWIIQMSGHDADVLAAAIEEILATANERVRQDAVRRVKVLIKQAETQRNETLADLQRQRQDAIADYDSATRSKLETLKEDAKIARAAGIVSRSLGAVPTGNETTIVTAPAEKLPDYYHGYLALEAQTKLLANRKDKVPFATALQKIDQSIRRLKSDKIIERASAEFEQSVLHNDAFTVASYSATGRKVSSGAYRFQLLLASLLFSLILAAGIVFPIFRLRKLLANKNAISAN